MLSFYKMLDDLWMSFMAMLDPHSPLFVELDMTSPITELNSTVLSGSGDWSLALSMALSELLVLAAFHELTNDVPILCYFNVSPAPAVFQLLPNDVDQMSSAFKLQLVTSTSLPVPPMAMLRATTATGEPDIEASQGLVNAAFARPSQSSSPQSIEDATLHSPELLPITKLFAQPQSSNSMLYSSINRSLLQTPVHQHGAMFENSSPSNSFFEAQ